MEKKQPLFRGREERLFVLQEARRKEQDYLPPPPPCPPGLREVGKHFTVNVMMEKESVRKRLEDRAHGISYTEFSYMLLQACDFLHLFREQGCRLQIGGSDQYGNITAGVDLIRRKRPEHDPQEKWQAYGLTTVLITDAAGEKIGKTTKGAVWLDPNKTSPFAFYQYWINTGDEDALKYLRSTPIWPKKRASLIVNLKFSQR